MLLLRWPPLLRLLFVLLMGSVGPLRRDCRLLLLLMWVLRLLRGGALLGGPPFGWYLSCASILQVRRLSVFVLGRGCGLMLLMWRLPRVLVQLARSRASIFLVLARGFGGQGRG